MAAHFRSQGRRVGRTNPSIVLRMALALALLAESNVGKVAAALHLPASRTCPVRTSLTSL